MDKREGISRRSLLAGVLSWVTTIGMVMPEAVAGSGQAFEVGSTKVQVNMLASGGGPTYFVPHEDEATALAVAKAAVRQYGGRVVWLSHGGGRNISFSLGGKKYAVDPNRMFSDKGAKASLRTLGNYSQEALTAVRSLGEGVTGVVFAKLGLVVGMHNNTNANYSALSYQAGGNLASEASRVFVAQGGDPDDFCFTTSSYIFEGLKAKGLSVVQQKRGIADDGSFSVRCQRSGVPYVNIEAQHGHTAKQKEMLKVLLSV